MRRVSAYLVGLVVVFGLAILVLPVLAQGGYELSWWTVDGGGGLLSDSSSGYALVGTVGQSDAKVWSGDGYTLAGGFWGGALIDYTVYLPLTLKDHMSISPATGGQ